MEDFDYLIMDAEIDLGDKAETFLGSELGRYIIGCAKQEIAAAQFELETCSPEDTDKIRELQDKARQARLAIDWLKEVIIKRDQNLELQHSEDDLS